MDAAKVNGLISMIPERVARVHTGSTFTAQEASGCKYPDRLALLMSFLGWLTPLNPLSKEDQRLLGVVAANARPMLAADEDEEPEGDLDELEDAGELMEAPQAQAEAQQPSPYVIAEESVNAA